MERERERDRERQREREDLFASLVFFNLSCWGVESWSRVQRFDFQLSIPGANLAFLGLELCASSLGLTLPEKVSL